MRDIVFENHSRSVTVVMPSLALESPPSSSTTTTAMTPPETEVGTAPVVGSSTCTVITTTAAEDQAGDMVLASPSSAATVRSSGSGLEELDLHSLASILSAKLMAMPRDGHGSCKAVLQGCLELLRDLVEIEGPDGHLLDGTELGQVGG